MRFFPVPLISSVKVCMVAVLALLALIPPVVGADTEMGAPTLQRHKPQIHWKYGWNDGNFANLTGSAKAGDIRPLGLSDLPSGGYTPSDLIHAYGYDQIHSSGGSGSNATIAIVVAFGSPTLQSDLDYFCTYLGIAPITANIVYPAGKPQFDDSGWAGEALMDVEWAHALAPDAKLTVVVSKDDSDANLNTCIRYASSNANVVSMSWGGMESAIDPSNHYLFTNTAVSFVAASGDSGKEVDWPPSDPNVLAVGGTSLLLSSSNTIVSETAWGLSSGGISRFQPFPSYQAGWSSVNSGRILPDVSLLADPYTGVYVYNTDPITHQAGWSINGGTSLACPMWAALLACRASLGTTPNGFVHPLLYGAAAIYGRSNLYEINPAIFRDITRRQPRYPNDSYQAFSPAGGYDRVTGIGSPVAPVVAALSPSSTSPVTINFPPFAAVTYAPRLTIPMIATSSRDGMPVTYVSSQTRVAQVSGSSLVIRGAGTSTITASMPGSPVTPVSQSLVVNKAGVSLSWSVPFRTPYKKNASLTFRGTSSPVLPITYTSDNTNVLSVVGSQARIRGTGTVLVTASVSGNENYLGTNIVKNITIY